MHVIRHTEIYLIQSIQMGMVRHTWVYQEHSRPFKTELSNDTDFLHIARLQQEQQIDTVISSGLQLQPGS